MKTLDGARIRFSRMIDLARGSLCRWLSMCVPMTFEQLKPLDPSLTMPARK